MDSLISAFHLDLGLLIAQLVNFGVVFIVLYLLIFKPLFKTTGDRSKTIAKSLEEAKEIEARLAKTKDEQAAMLKEAKISAAEILTKAAQEAEAKKTETIEKAKEEIGALINREKARMQVDKSNTLKEIRQEVGDLIAASWQKILQEKMDKPSDEKLISKIISHLR